MFTFNSLAACLWLAGCAAQGQHADHQSQSPHGCCAQPADSARAGEQEVPYLAGVCPISGKKLGAMGDPVLREYDGREVRFCCEMCIPKFEAAGDDGWKKLDKILIEDQLPYYPLSTCIISGEPLTEDGEDAAVNVIYHSRLVRFCCKDCVEDFMKDPEAALRKVDAAVIEQQRDAYPLETCVVSGEELGEMGDPYEVVLGNRFVRLCCSDCEGTLIADPTEYLGPLDAAWKEKGLPPALDAVPDVEHHEDSPAHEHGHAGHDDHGG